MIDRQHGKIQIECDSCDSVYEGTSDEFDSVWAAAKDEGWSVRKINDVWVHGCPTCGRPT